MPATNDCDHQPQGSQPEDTREGILSLASGLVDGEIRVYVKEKDSGLRIGLDPDGQGLVVRVDEVTRLAKGDD